MSNHKKDIGDDEIRIIAPIGKSAAPTSSHSPKESSRKSHLWWRNLLIGMVAGAGLCIIGFIMFYSRHKDAEEDLQVEQVAPGEETMPKEYAHAESEISGKDIISTASCDSVAKIRAYTGVRDTTVNNVGLRILTPENAHPVLKVGVDALSDSVAVLALQAADIRGDNGDIAGAFVLKGELLSKGNSKSGFCAIINGELTLGVADATPMLEKVIESEGYFFRQYPLVVGRQLVENKPKGKALRKALAETDGKISVILSKERLTFHDFSKALVDIGVHNAIYLVGGAAPGIYTDESGERYSFGSIHDSLYEKTNYIMWE